MGRKPYMSGASKSICAIVTTGLVVASFCLTAREAAAETVARHEFADWTQVSSNVATGTLLGSSISLAGTLVRPVPSSTLDGTSPIFNSPAFTPPLPASDSLEFGGFQPAYTYTLTFGAPTTDPVLHLQSLGSALAFEGVTQITKVSGDSSLLVAGNTVSATSGQPDANGTVRLAGTFSSLSFTAATVDPAIQPDGIGIQVGVKPPPPPPPPPPATAQPPVNVIPPRIDDVGGGSYSCNPGEWRNLPAPPDYRFRWVRFPPSGGSPLPVARTQTYTPNSLSYGYQVACEVAVTGPDGLVRAMSPRVVFSSAGMNKLPPAYGDVRIRGIDIAQIVQPNTRAWMYGYPNNFPNDRFETNLCGGGTASQWRKGLRSCGTLGRDPQNVTYNGVKLDRYKRAVALVYVDVANAEAADTNLTYDLELSATSGGRSLGSPVVAKIKNPPRSFSPWVNLSERDTTVGPIPEDSNRHAVPVLLPPAWRSGTIQLTARLRFPDGAAYGTEQYGTRECDAEGCLANDVFTLNNVPFTDFPELRLATLELRRLSAGQGPLRPAGQVLERGRQLFPGGSRVDVPPYRETLDITDETNLVASWYPEEKIFRCNGMAYKEGTSEIDVVQACQWSAIAATMRDWITRNPARRNVSGGIFGSDAVIRDYDVAMGAHDYPLQRAAAQGNILSVGRSTPTSADDVPLMTVRSASRPLTSAAHELGHILTAPHAGQACPFPVDSDLGPNLTGPGTGAQEGEIWRGDDRGQLQGTKFTVGHIKASATAEVEGPFSFPNGGTSAGGSLFDLMSYCVPTNDTYTSDGNVWISAFNWNRFVTELGKLSGRLGASASRAMRPAAGRAAGGPRSYAVGVAGPASGTIMRVARGDGQAAVPRPVAGSPYKLRSLAADGRVLLEAGVAIQPSSESADGTGTFVGPVADAASAVVLVRGTTVLSAKARTRAPTVRVLSPTRRTRVRAKGQFTVRWRATDPDSRALRATVDYAPDGRNWRSVFEGRSKGRARVPGRYLAASKRARIRVTVNDGFAQASAISRPFRADGTKPRMEILSPEQSASVQTGERVTLSGRGTDDFGIPIRGTRLTWFADRKLLGRGSSLRRQLPRGTRKLRLVARDRTGRIGTATLSVRVRAPRLRLIGLQVPAKVARKARSMKIRLHTSAPATLTAGGRRYRVGRRTVTLKVRLPRRPAVGIVTVSFKLSPRGGAAAGTIRGTLSVLRT